MRKISLILGLLVAFAGFATGQVLPDQAQTEAWRTFNQKQGGKAFIRWHDETGTPATIYGFKSKPYSALQNPEDIARQFLKDNRIIFKMKIDLSDLNLLSDFEDNGVHHLDFKQTYRDIPVYGAEYSVAVGKDKTIHMAGGTYYPHISAPTSTIIPEEEAINNARIFLNIKISDVSDPISELIIVPGDSQFLAYRLWLNEWDVLINAQTGKVEKYGQRMFHIDGIGKVYPKDPVNSLLTTVTIPRLAGGGYELRGTYVDVTNGEDGDAYSTSGNFEYTPPSYTQHDGTHFDDTNMYFHIDNFANNYWPIVGYSGLNQITVTVHTDFSGPCGYMGQDNARFCPGDGNLYFGHGESIFWDLAKKDDIIFHEYTHAVSYDIGFTPPGWEEEGRAMHEGYSDYHAASFTNNAQIGEWATRNYPDLRRVDMPKIQYNYNNYNSLPAYSENTLGSAHHKSMIWSGALWDLRGILGSSITDFLVYKGLVYKNASNSKFLDGREGVISADQNYNNGVNVNIIMNVFAARGIGDPSLEQPPTTPTGLQITNLGSILENPQLSWNASTGATSYNIYRCVGYLSSCSYLIIGSTSSTSFKDVDVMITSAAMATGNYFYKVKAVNSYGISGYSDPVSTWGESFDKMRDEVADINNSIPRAFALESNYPNPFNPSTMIKYSLPEASSVSLVIYDLIGSEIFKWSNNREDAGYKWVAWNGKDKKGNSVPAGVYIYKLTAKSHESDQVFTQSRKMVLMK